MPEGTGREDSIDQEEVPELILRLRSIVERARYGDWPGWTEGDTFAVSSAIQGLTEFPEIVQQAIRSGFEIGREHGQKEKVLAELEQEIALETSRLARQAWGR